jgi:hypothetical protein
VSQYRPLLGALGALIMLGVLAFRAGLPDQQIPSPLPVTIGSSTGKTVVMKTGNLVTTATTADQVILTYTVTSGKTFYLEYVDVTARLTTYATTATNFGNASLESPSGTKLATALIANAGTVFPPYALRFSEPIPIASGTVIRVVCTPAATTSFTWQANFGGWEK